MHMFIRCIVRHNFKFQEAASYSYYKSEPSFVGLRRLVAIFVSVKERRDFVPSMEVAMWNM